VEISYQVDPVAVHQEQQKMVEHLIYQVHQHITVVEVEVAVLTDRVAVAPAAWAAVAMELTDRVVNTQQPAHQILVVALVDKVEQTQILQAEAES
jgi:hypothetical protein